MLTNISVKILSPIARSPSRAFAHSVRLDVHSIVEKVIPPFDRSLINTGISISISPGYYARLASRSGLSLKYGIEVGVGVIDPDYKGEIKVILYNNGAIEFQVKVGDRVAQIILERCSIAEANTTKDNVSDREDKGFGRAALVDSDLLIKSTTNYG